MIIKFRNTNAFGNNLYIDDVNITALCVGCTRDIQVVSIDQPRGAECSTDITPAATVRNRGVETITGFNIAYSIDSGSVQTTNVTGVSLAKNDTIHVNLNPSTGLSIGQHHLVVYYVRPYISRRVRGPGTNQRYINQRFWNSGNSRSTPG